MYNTGMTKKLLNEITYNGTPKANHCYVQVINGEKVIVQVKDLVIGEKYLVFAVVAGGSHTQPKILEIPIPLCGKHNNDNMPFMVHTCSNWDYICIPVTLGSSTCRLCKSDLSQPAPYLKNANLKNADLYSAILTDANLTSANLRHANLYDANLTSANLYDANLTSANLYYANLTNANLYNAGYNKYTHGLTDEQKKDMILIE